jgi:PST family polysaccharide transporter
MLNLNLDKLFFKITAMCSFFGLICNFFMSRQFGYLGTALNVIIVETIVTCVLYFALKKRGIALFEIKKFMPKEFWYYFNYKVI